MQFPCIRIAHSHLICLVFRGRGVSTGIHSNQVDSDVNGGRIPLFELLTWSGKIDEWLQPPVLVWCDPDSDQVVRFQATLVKPASGSAHKDS